MSRAPRRHIWIVLACGLVAAAFSSQGHPTKFEDSVPETTVDPVIAPVVYQGGTVVMRVTVAVDGSVTRIEVVRPFPALTDPVVTAVRQWRFKPARLDGRPVEATTTVALHVALIRTVVPR
jgi:TonB family protein